MVQTTHDRLVSRLLGTTIILIAVGAVLIGQPASYWQNPATVHEANPMSKFFLENGWWAFAAYILAQMAVPWLIALRVAPVIDWALAFGMALGGFFGGSNWLFYEWRLGLQAAVVYALLLSIVIVRQVLKRNQGVAPEELSANIRSNALSRHSFSVRCVSAAILAREVEDQSSG